MLLRNRIARGLAAGALVLAVPTLAGCGMNFATDKVYTPAPGANNRAGDVDVLNAAIVASADGKGTLVATFSNNVQGKPGDDATTGDDTLTGISGDVSATLPTKKLVIPAGGLLALNAAGADSVDKPGPKRAAGIPVTGDFVLGDFVKLTLQFANAGTVEIEVPVVCNANHFEGEDGDGELTEACKTDLETHGSGEGAESGH